MPRASPFCIFMTKFAHMNIECINRIPMKKILSGVLAFAAIAVGSAKEVEIKLYQTSDVHGSYFPCDFITGKPLSGSLARVATVVGNAREKYGDNVLLVDNGDILQGQPTVYYYNYIDTVVPHITSEIMNYMKYDVVNVGNHDVETGRATLDRWASQCKMPVLGANIIETATGKPHFQPYEVFERDGVKIAILGMITPAIPAWLPEVLWEGLKFEDMESTARRWIPVIKEKENPDVIIGLFHAGQDGNILINYKENPSLEIAREVPGFDVVLIGHDHRRDIKRVVNVEGDTVLVMNPANNADFVTDITMKFEVDDSGKVVDKTISGELLDLSAYIADSNYMNRFNPEIETINAYVSEPLGVFTETISTRDSYFGSSEFVDLIHELQLALSGADISFVAPLSYDAMIPAGEIKVADMFHLYKYENMLYVMELTGREIKGCLEESYRKWVNTMTSPDDHLLLLKEQPVQGEAGRSTLLNRSYNFDSAAGIRYIVDVTKPAGEKVEIISMADGSPFELDKTYRVALNSYRGNGGGELLTDGAGIPHDKLSHRIVYSTDRDMRYYLSQYIKEQGTIHPHKLNQWRFVPEELVIPAAKRDYKILFPGK